MWKVPLWVFLSAVLAVGCGEKDDPVNEDDSGISEDGANQDGDFGGGEEDAITYTIHIKPILDANCIQCHATAKQGADRNGAPVGVNFDTYTEASNSANGANSRIQAGTMPPGGGIPTGDRSLFQKWIDQGTLE